MKLKIKFLKWSAGLPVAMLNESTAKKIGVYPKDHVSIKTFSSSPRKTSTVIDVSNDFVRNNEIAVSLELKEILGISSGDYVFVTLTPPPKSLDIIKKKLIGGKLSQEEIQNIISDVVSNTLSEAEIAMFVSAMYSKGMDIDETVYLIKAMLKTGNKISFNKKIVADKHRIGGIPGNRTTPIVVSICASVGLTIPKSSSKAITSEAGTSDVIETIAPVEFSPEEVKKIVAKTGACLVWGGALEMLTADTKIIQIEKTLKLDPEAQLLASIMSKKLAMGSNHILIDIPFGDGAKVSHSKAMELKNKFELIGKKFNKKVKCVLTDGTQPIGNGIGPVLGMKDILKVLRQDCDRPFDLEKKALFLSGELLELTGKAKKGNGENLAREILSSGKALEKFAQIIEAQGGKIKDFPEADFQKDIFAHKDIKIKKIHNKRLIFLSRILGCPTDKFAGIYLYNHVNEHVKNGQKIVTLYSSSESRLKEAIEYYDNEKIIISD